MQDDLGPGPGHQFFYLLWAGGAQQAGGHRQQGQPVCQLLQYAGAYKTARPGKQYSFHIQSPVSACSPGTRPLGGGLFAL